jgi:ribosome-associated translation inhibitor RaiA
MIIKLQAPKDSIAESLVQYLSTKLLELKRKHPEISSADVYMREPTKAEKSCAVSLKARGLSLMVSHSAQSFSKACFSVLLELEQRLQQFFVRATWHRRKK